MILFLEASYTQKKKKKKKGEKKKKKKEASRTPYRIQGQSMDHVLY